MSVISENGFFTDVTANRLQYLEIRHDPEYIGEWIINRAATIRCYKGSKADRYCQESGFKVEYL